MLIFVSHYISHSHGRKAEFNCCWKGCQIQCFFANQSLFGQFPSHSNPMDIQLAWCWPYGIFSKNEVSLWLNKKSQNETVAKGWLYTLCGWDAIYTHDNSWKKWPWWWWGAVPSCQQRRHLGGLVGPSPPKEKKKKKKKKKKRKKRKREKKEKQKEGNYEWRQIPTYKVLFFPIFQ